MGWTPKVIGVSDDLKKMRGEDTVKTLKEREGNDSKQGIAQMQDLKQDFLECFIFQRFT